MNPVGPSLPSVQSIDLRSARRFRVLQQAKIVFGKETMIHCEVRDLSTGGAKIALRPNIRLPEKFDLFICAQDLRVHKVRLRWRQGSFVGVSFGADDMSAPAEAPPPSLEAPAGSYPVLVRSNRLIASQPTERPLLPALDRIPPSGGSLARATIQPGRYGWERRRRRYGRGA